MAPKFGTSGLRGLVVELTPALVAAHVRAFLRACDTGGRLYLGRDLRAASPGIAAVVAAAAREAGAGVVDCGAVPTPALALAAAGAGAGAVMVTGSHIPDDRNGLKFYTRRGEITKAEEAAILAALEPGESAPPAAPPEPAGAETATLAAYAARYLDAFPAGALKGLRIGVYEHSTVARDLLGRVLSGLGAEVTGLGRADRFIPVDTEAVSGATRAQLADWAAGGRFDAIVSADGDADRPLLADAAGRVVPGDVLGLLTARFLGARVVVTPVSSTTALERSRAFARVLRTRIGSPFVIAGIEAEREADARAKVVGFEANGGFLLGFAARLPGGGMLAPLPTRDALLPLLAPLALAREAGGLAAFLAALPARATAADRLQEVDQGRVAALLGRLAADPAARTRLFGGDGAIDLTDGVRLTLADGDILHLRASGNAPELRCYAEAATPEAAARLVAETLARVAAEIGKAAPAGD